MRKLDDFIPKSHPLRSIRVMANEALAKMDRLFAQMYEADIKGGRPSIAPEKLLRAILIQALFSIPTFSNQRSETACFGAARTRVTGRFPYR